MTDKAKIKTGIKEIEKAMLAPDFWQDKEKAQRLVRKLDELKDEALGVNKYDKLDAVITIFSGAGGDDAEDFSRILYDMYQRYVEKRGWSSRTLHAHKNDRDGYRNITFEVSGKGVYGTLKNESGVHRLVRISPFNAKKQRHTSFSMVEVIPKLGELAEISIPDDELEIQFARSSGPGGQNVNKVASAVQLRFDLVGSPSLPEDVKQRLMKLGGKRVNADGVLIIEAKRYRTQNKNRDNAITRLVVLIKKAAEQPKPRVKSAGARLIQANVDIYRVSKFLGHSSVTVTERHYVDLLRENYQDIAKISEAELKKRALYVRSKQTKTD
ncbi:MAG: aminoacyl-tRNA hydrolase [Candidatus Marinimicrobia bacterium]|nr:aminoacyl-tRNA hydrolase [Candidatus Neomarinimicrobiota bacterium]